MSIPRSIRVILLSLTTLLLLWNCQIDMSPVARDDTAVTDRNVPVTITVVANDTAGTGHIVASTVAVVAGPEHGTARAQADGTVIYSPATDFVGTDSFSYVVADITGETSNAATVTVTVRAVNRAPVANAGPDMNAVTGQPVILDGAQSFDPDRDPLSFAWQFVAVPATSSVTTASLANAQTAAPSFTPDVDGTYGLELTVSDGTLSSTDQVQVTTVSRPNVPPNANAGQHQTAQVGTVVLLDGRGSQDPDNGPQPLTFQWSFVAVPPESILTTADLQGATTPLANFTSDVVGVYRVSLQVSDGRDTSQAEVQITVMLPNVPPDADAGLPMVVQLGAAATLNGTASHDPDNGPQPLTYQWTLVSTPVASGLTNASIQDATTATASFTPDVAGLYILRLDVSDGALSDFAQVLVKANVAPVAADDTFEARQDQPLTVLAPGVLSNDTDGNNDPLTVVLGNTVSHGALTLNTDGSFTYTPTTDFLGIDSFTYQANDGSVDSNRAAVTVTVGQGIPTAITLTPNPLTLTPSTTGSVTVALTRPAGPAGQVVTLLSSNSAVASVPPSVTIPANASSTTVTVTAGTTPGAATLSASAPGLTGGSTTVTVSQDMPAAITLTPNPLTLTPSTTGSVTAALTRPAGPAGQVVTLLSSNSAVASVPPSVTIPANASSTAVTVTAGTTPGAATISASAPGLTGGSTTVNVRCPTLTVTPPGVTTGIINVPFSQSFSQSGALGTATFTVASGTLPTGLTLAASGLLAGTPTQTGSFPITVRVTDTNGCTGTSAPYPLSIGQVPALTSANATTFTVGAVGMFTITATGSPAPTFGATGTLPAGVTLNSTTGVLAGTPGPGTAGSYPLTITASNGIGSPAMQLFTLTVSKGKSTAITLTPNPLTLNPSTTGSVTVALTRPAGPAGQVVTLLSSNSAVASVPPSVTIPANASSTAVTVTAGTTPGAATLSASAPGLTGGSTTVNVRCPTLTVTPPGVTTGIINVPFSQSFSQTGALGTATFTVASGTLPTGLTLAASGLLAGTPTQTGSFPITVRVTDTNGCTGTSATYPLTIGQVPAITSANATSFAVGVAGTFTVTATGSPVPTFTVTAGTLPAGLTLSSTGMLSGIPGPGTAGIYSLTITASNGVGSPAMQVFTLTVLCPPITVNPMGPALAEGTFGVAYSQTFTASGGTTPHSFAVSAGVLPDGLTLASGGGLTGSPMSTGNFSFTVTATDVNLCPGSTAYTLLVRPNAQPESFANGVGNTQYVVGLAAPVTPAVVVAESVLASVLANDTGSGALNAGPASITSANGSVAMNPNGTFTYTPAVGFAGPSDTFTYTLTDGNGMTNTALVTINLSEVVWYVNFSGTNGDGRSHSPFNTLNNAQTQSAEGHTIFVHTSAAIIPDGIVLKPRQTLWGQGTPFKLNGLTVAATGKPTVTDTIVLASNVTVSSLDVNTEGSPGITDPNDPPGPASAITGVIITNAVAITTTTGTAVSLSDTSGALAFERITADGAVNGISLTNTAGSFTVTGDGASALNDTGGTITNMTGDSISLTNVENASFSRMNITGSDANGIFGTDVNGFVVDWCIFSNNGNATGESAIRFGDETNNNINGLVGSSPAGSNPTRITNSRLSGSFERAVSIFNTSDTLTELDVTNSTFQLAARGSGFLIETRDDAVATVIVTGSTFQNNFAAGLQGSALAQSNLTLNVTGSTFQNNNEGLLCSNQNDADVTCEISDNIFIGHPGSAIFVGNGTPMPLTSMASLNGKILNNNVTMLTGGINHTILSNLRGSGSFSALRISGNMVSNNVQFDGIRVDTPDTGTSPNFSVTVTNNDVTTTKGENAISLNAQQRSRACFNVRLNKTAAPVGNGVQVRRVTPAMASLEKGGGSISDTASNVLRINNPDATGSTPTSVPGAVSAVSVVENGTCVTPTPP